MRVTKEIMTNFLSFDEMKYKEATKFGSDALPYLEEIIRTDPNLASKAVCLVGLIKDPKSIPILINASKSPFSSVRVSLALTASNLKIDDISSGKILKLLENDKEDIVRRTVTKSRVKRRR